MNAAAWICLGLPLASTLAIAGAGTRISRRGAGYLSTATTFGAFAAAVVAFVVMLGEDAGDRAHATTSWTWLSAGQYHFGLTLLTDQLSVMMMLIVTGVGGLIVAYSVGYMDGEDEERRYFAYMSLFVFSMLLLVQGGSLLMLLVALGNGRPLELPVDRLPSGPAVGGRRSQEGVRDERVRRRDDSARALPADPAHRQARLRGRIRRPPHGGRSPT